MNSFTLTVGDKDYRIKPGAAAVVEAEKRIGKSLLTAMDDIDQTECFAAILWAGLQKFNSGMPWPRVYALIDAMDEHGCSFCGKDYPDGGLEMKSQLALEVLKVGGFFTTKQIQAMVEAMTEAIKENDESTTI